MTKKVTKKDYDIWNIERTQNWRKPNIIVKELDNIYLDLKRLKESKRKNEDRKVYLFVSRNTEI